MGHHALPDDADTRYSQAAENKLLAKDPPTFRLACQTLVEGPCSIRNKPDA